MRLVVGLFLSLIFMSQLKTLIARSNAGFQQIFTKYNSSSGRQKASVHPFHHRLAVRSMSSEVEAAAQAAAAGWVAVIAMNKKQLYYSTNCLLFAPQCIILTSHTPPLQCCIGYWSSHTVRQNHQQRNPRRCDLRRRRLSGLSRHHPTGPRPFPGDPKGTKRSHAAVKSATRAQSSPWSFIVCCPARCHESRRPGQRV